MSNIEKALKKHRNDLNKNDKNVAPPNKQDGKDKESLYSKALAKDGLVDQGLSLNNKSRKTSAKLSRRDELITSAINKEKDDDTYLVNTSANQDRFNINATDKIDFIPAILETERKEKEVHDVFPSTTLDKFTVEESIVSYYEHIGKQVWEGPVMVYFRRLAIMLQNTKKNNNCSVITFASANQGDGKSLLALNTAITLCKDKMTKVAIVDCDFRKSAVNKLLGFSPNKGLADYLNENADIKDISYTGLVPRFTIIPAGNRPLNICELLGSDKQKHLLSLLKDSFDFVIIDTPPILAFPDAQVISSLSDGVILIIDNQKTKKGIARRAKESLHNCTIIGCVVNRSNANTVGSYGYDYSYYQ